MHSKPEFERHARNQLERLVGQQAAKVVEAEVGGFANWWADGETPATAAWLALETTGRVVRLAFAEPSDAASVARALRSSIDPDTRTSTLRPGTGDEFFTVRSWSL